MRTASTKSRFLILNEMVSELTHQLGLPEGRPTPETIELACSELGIRPSGSLVDRAQACAAEIRPGSHVVNRCPTELFAASGGN